MDIAIVKYNAGNTQSVSFALDRLGIKYNVTADHRIIESADKVIFPGVGNAESAMKSLVESGLDKLLPSLNQPFLGICLGMQLMAEFSEEGSLPVKCLGIVEGTVKKFAFEENLISDGYKIPHTGWNKVQASKHENWMAPFQDEFFYFVHSYYLPTQKYTQLVCTYGLNFSAALAKENFYGCQFHPEKSAEVGAKFLLSFIQNT